MFSMPVKRQRIAGARDIFRGGDRLPVKLVIVPPAIECLLDAPRHRHLAIVDIVEDRGYLHLALAPVSLTHEIGQFDCNLQLPIWTRRSSRPRRKTPVPKSPRR